VQPAVDADQGEPGSPRRAASSTMKSTGVRAGEPAAVRETSSSVWSTAHGERVYPGLYRSAYPVGGCLAMGAWTRLGVVVVVTSAIAACGGTSPPAETGGTTGPAGSGTPDTSFLFAGPEPAPSAELNAGIKAFDAGSYADA